MLGVPELLCMAAGTWLFLLSLRPPPRILGVYSRPGFWYPLKLVLFYLLLRLRQWREDASDGEDEDSPSESSSNLGSNSGVGSGAGMGSSPGQKVKKRPTPEMMECVQPLSNHPQAIDAVYFNSGNATGHYLVAATARRPKGIINGLLYIRIPGVGLLQLPKMPDTFLFGDGESFAAEGLRITPLEPMATWRIQYEGPMKMRGSPLSHHQVELDVTFTSDQPYFHFDTDMDLWTLARCVAREPWSPHFFHILQEAHQSHYEQMGRLEGTAVVDGLAHVLRLHSMRDHSYGHRREWKLMHRYGLHMFSTEDGLQGNVGVICQPTVLSQLEMGYVCKDGQIEPVTKVDLLLWQHGENGHPPSDYAFSFTAGGTEYLVEVTVLEAPEFYIGWEWETRVVECMVSFRVNGRKGWGVAEWDYRNHGGRPHIYTSQDPAWTADIVKECDDETGEMSEDGLRCVVHYPELHLSKRTKVILLSERSYNKLLQCTNIRSELKGEERHFPQCQGVPVPTYDPHLEGYHRPCYLKFVRVARKESKSELPKEIEEHTKNEVQGEPPKENHEIITDKLLQENQEIIYNKPLQDNQEIIYSKPPQENQEIMYDKLQQENQEIIYDKLSQENHGIINDKRLQEDQEIIIDNPPQENLGIIDDKTRQENPEIIDDNPPQENPEIINDKTLQENQEIIDENPPQENHKIIDDRSLQKNQETMNDSPSQENHEILNKPLNENEVLKNESNSEQPPENYVVTLVRRRRKSKLPKVNQTVKNEAKSELSQENHCNGFVMHDSNE